MAYAELGANTVAQPKAILHPAIDLNSASIANDSLQLAKQLGLVPLFHRLHDIENKLKILDNQKSLEGLSLRQDLLETRQQIFFIIGQTCMEVQFVTAEIDDEHNLYTELLNTYTNDRDRTVAWSNMVSFITNGALWAVGEALDIPTYRYPKLSIPSGTVSILAGVVPSIASIYAMHVIGGHRYSADADPNMLAKLFDYPVPPALDYPESVWTYLNSAEAADDQGKTRRELIISRWITDKNISGFTDRNSKAQLDLVTATTPSRKGITIAVLSERLIMLQELSTEVTKMNRLLLELMMVAHGQKAI
jgi:hypothetical protein